MLKWVILRYDPNFFDEKDTFVRADLHFLSKCAIIDAYF